MINKKKTIIYLIILLFFMQFIINYGLFFYNKKYKINFNIENFIEKTFSLENNIITYYERDVLNNDSSLNTVHLNHPLTQIICYQIFLIYLMIQQIILK